MADESKEIAFIGIDEKGFPFIREPVKISLSSYKNAKYLDIRKYYEKNGEWLPTTKGITINGEIFDKLVEVLSTHGEEIKNWLNEKK
jgi:hypothetical protein